MANKPLPPTEILRQLFRYDSKTGNLYWKDISIDFFKIMIESKINDKCKKWNLKYANKEVCSKRKPEKVVTIFGENYFYHRIVFAVVNGIDPKDYMIDHVNGNNIDNRIENLEIVTPRQNQRRRKYQKSGRVERDLFLIREMKKRVQ